jgi:hypothetical protein
MIISSGVMPTRCSYIRLPISVNSIFLAEEFTHNFGLDPSKEELLLGEIRDLLKTK